jgi:hypothetical protein
MYGLEFRVIPEATSTFLTKQFALLRPISFLALTTSNPHIPARCTSFELGTADHQSIRGSAVRPQQVYESNEAIRTKETDRG